MSTYQEQLAEQRSYLLKYARLQLRNEAWAEDAVSETVLAALARPQAFAGRSQLKTWLIGVLKHKVVDILRQQGREVFSADLSAGHLADEAEDPLDSIAFQSDGHFVEAPADWGNPEQMACQRQFFEVLEACAQHLPVTQARLFLMREWLELDSEEICQLLKLTPGNLYVQLHRARGRLRECLELNWFATTKTLPEAA